MATDSIWLLLPLFFSLLSKYSLQTYQELITNTIDF